MNVLVAPPKQAVSTSSPRTSSVNPVQLTKEEASKYDAVDPWTKQSDIKLEYRSRTDNLKQSSRSDGHGYKKMDSDHIKVSSILDVTGHSKQIKTSEEDAQKHSSKVNDYKAVIKSDTIKQNQQPVLSITNPPVAFASPSAR